MRLIYSITARCCQRESSRIAFPVLVTSSAPWRFFSNHIAVVAMDSAPASCLPVSTPDRSDGGFDKTLYRKRRVVVTYGYNGTHFFGSQYSRNPSHPAAENSIEEAACKLGLIAPSNQKHPEKISLLRSSRTDKGVHAIANIASFKALIPRELLSQADVGDGSDEGENGTSTSCTEIPGKSFDAYEMADRFNEVIEPKGDIRVISVHLTGRGFVPRSLCRMRTYEYLIPKSTIELLNPLLTDEKKITRILQNLYLGTRNFQHFTSGHDAPQLVDYLSLPVNARIQPDSVAESLRSAKARKFAFRTLRTIFDITCERWGDSTTEDLYCIRLSGNSFMYNQIRKMVGVFLLCIHHAHAHPEMFGSLLEADVQTESWKSFSNLFFESPFLIHLPIAPGFPLLLDECSFTGTSARDEYIPYTQEDEKRKSSLKHEVVYQSLQQMFTSSTVQSREWRDFIIRIPYHVMTDTPSFAQQDVSTLDREKIWSDQTPLLKDMQVEASIFSQRISRIRAERTECDRKRDHVEGLAENNTETDPGDGLPSDFGRECIRILRVKPGKDIQCFRLNLVAAIQNGEVPAFDAGLSESTASYLESVKSVVGPDVIREWGKKR
eukprot:ANDGO_08389.mRNA.1 Putative tRNA pseudouridine synthase